MAAGPAICAAYNGANNHADPMIPPTDTASNGINPKRRSNFTAILRKVPPPRHPRQAFAPVVAAAKTPPSFLHPDASPKPGRSVATTRHRASQSAY